jgi:hypothetical protein
MRVSIAKGEKLGIHIIEGNRIVGALSICLDAISSDAIESSVRDGSDAGLNGEPKRRGRKPGSVAAKPARKTRNYSPEAKARMREAQKRRWDRIRAEKAAQAAQMAANSGNTGE